MAIVTIKKEKAKELLGNLADRDIDNQLSMFGAAVENIGNETIDLEIPPNRPDMLSAQGFFRALSTYLGKKPKQYEVNKPLKDYEVKIDSSVKDIRPFTACAIVKNLKFDDDRIKEMIDIQEKLHLTLGRDRKKVAIGIYPLEKIQLPITFKAEDPDTIKFIPLEMDKEMTGRQILSKHPKGRDYAHLLEGMKKYPVFRDNKGDVLSMPPIINSQMTGKITEETKDVFIECSGFDFQVLNKTLNILVTALADMGGEIYAMKLDYEKKTLTPNLTPEKIKINISDAEKLLGITLKETEVKKFLERMGHSYNNGIVEYPAYRTDIMHPADIYEDIAIAYGYDNIAPELPDVFTIGSENETEVKKRKISEILTGLGLLEISSYHLIRKEDLTKSAIKKAHTEVLNSKTDYNTLRPCLLTNSLRTLSENTDAKYPQKIFELGRVFEDKEGEIEEKEKLCIAITGETDFTEIKQILDYLMRMINKEYKIDEASHPVFIEGRTGKILIDNKEIGVLGEVLPNIMDNWNLKMPTVLLEIEIENL